MLRNNKNCVSPIFLTIQLSTHFVNKHNDEMVDIIVVLLLYYYPHLPRMLPNVPTVGELS